MGSKSAVKLQQRKSLPAKEQAMTMSKRIVYVFLAASIILLAASVPNTNMVREFTVVLDAGHGGHDPGNLGTGRYKATEKDVALDVTLQVGEYIEENIEGVKVIYTRDGDSFLKLKDRVEIANSNQADLFISIHCNSFTNNAYGTETYVMGMHKSEQSLRNAMKENASIYLEENYQENYAGFDPEDPDTYIALSLRQNVNLDQSLFLSKEIQDQFRDRVGRRDRGVKQAGYYVISFTTMPSVLVELGFLTNKEEEDFLNSEKGQTYMASAIYRAFKNYKNIMEGRNGELVIQEKVEDADILEEATISETLSESPEEEEKVLHLEKRNSELIYETSLSGLQYKIQITTSSSALEKDDEHFLGLEQVDEYLSGGNYKYTAGCSDTYQEAKENLKVLSDLGFKGAFIVAFNGEDRIPLSEALSLENQ